MLKTRVRIEFEDNDTLSVDNVHSIVFDIGKYSDIESEKIMINFTDKEKGEGTALADRDAIKIFHIELYDEDQKYRS